MPQRIAEQRMVIGNDKAGGRSGSHLVLAKGCGKTRDGLFGASQANFPLQLSTDGQSHASAQYCLAAKRLIGRRLCAAIGRTRQTFSPCIETVRRAKSLIGRGFMAMLP